MVQFELLGSLNVQNTLLSVLRAENYYTKFNHICRLSPSKKIGFKLETSRAIYEFVLFSEENLSAQSERDFNKKINEWLRIL